MMMVDDLGGGVTKRSFCDDVICEQPHYPSEGYTLLFLSFEYVIGVVVVAGVRMGNHFTPVHCMAD